MDKTLVYALLVSGLMHCAILWPMHLIVKTPHPDIAKKPIVVDYKTIRETPRLPQEAPITLRQVETPKVEIPKEIRPKPSPAPAPEAAKKAVKPSAEPSQELASKQAQIRSTQDYINYYQLLREKIRRSLKNRYKQYHKEGEVALRFSLASDGALVSCDVDTARSTDDATLRSIARQSVRDSSPFPGFPKALNVPNMSFELVISFRKDE